MVWIVIGMIVLMLVGLAAFTAVVMLDDEAPSAPRPRAWKPPPKPELSPAARRRLLERGPHR